MMQTRDSQKIRTKLLVPFSGSLLVILAAIFWNLHLFQQEQQQTFADRKNAQLIESFDQAIARDTELLEGLLLFIGTRESLQQAWLQDDREALFAASAPVFETLRRKHRITHFYYHRLDGTNYLRVHVRERHDDPIHRGTLRQAMHTGETAAGIEFGTLGQFVLRVVMPWRIDGKLVGYIELGEEIDHILERVSATNGYGLVLSVSRDFLVRQGLDTSQNFRNRSGQDSPDGAYLVINQTTTGIPVTLDRFINNHNESGYTVLTDAGKHYLASRVAVRDYSGEEIGTLTYISDISDYISNRRNLMANIILMALLLSAALFIFYYQYSGRLQRWLSASQQKLVREINERKNIQDELIRNKQQLETLVAERDHSLAESEKRYQTLFDKTADALLIIEDSRFSDCNQAALDMLGYRSKEDLLHTHPSALSPEYQPDGRASVEKANEFLSIALDKGSHRFEWDHVRKNGELFPVEVLLTAIPCGGTQLLHVVWRDITERRHAEAEIYNQAYYDSLTGLPNRKLLLDRLNQSLITSRRHDYFDALLFLDLDRFKTINDSLGHSVGDQLLADVAERIRENIWDEDTASRFGGDEFVILIKHLGQDKQTTSLNAERIALRIQAALKQPFHIKGNELHITASIGITVFPFLNENAEDIIKYADTAMFSAKESGRNQTAFYLSRMHEKVLGRLTLEKDLRKAICENQLEIHYQPQVSRHGDVVAVEALLRWQHPELGFVNPEEFIAIAEDTGQIFDLGDFVLKRAISDILTINRQTDYSLKLSVNISPHQFRRENFVSKIRHLVENFQLDTYFLTLEVTERIAIDDLAETIEKFEQLRHVGVRLSLDDFGTGYSSLVHLKRLPIDELKIDKSFVFDLEDDPQDALLVGTILKIAHQFGLDTVAEGVETGAQRAFLQREGCSIYQGYFFSRPLPLEQLQEYLLNKGRTRSGSGVSVLPG